MSDYECFEADEKYEAEQSIPKLMKTLDEEQNENSCLGHDIFKLKAKNKQLEAENEKLKKWISQRLDDTLTPLMYEAKKLLEGEE